MGLGVLRVSLVAVVIASSAGIPALAQSDQTNLQQIQSEIATQRERYAELHASGSTDQLLQLLDQDAFYAGTLQPQWIKGKEAIRAEKEAFFRRYPTRRLTFEDSQVRVYGEVAIDTGFLRMAMQAPGRPQMTTPVRYSMVWVRRPEGWRLVNMTADRTPGGRNP
jgi:ketosteroid isomerase-like protein